MFPFDLARLKEELEECRAEFASPDYWRDVDKAQQMNRRIKQLEGKIQGFESLQARSDDILTLIELGEQENDATLVAEIGAEILQLSNDVSKLRIQTLLKGEYDGNNAILSLHAGAGGTEAQDWTEMLFRMYTRYCEKNGYTVRVLDMLEGDEAGLKSVTFEANGANAYGYLKAERGVHRLVRISPFDANARRHTSFASVDVMPEINDTETVEIRDVDLKVDTYRSSGAGG
ncbi:MAG TPA: PCRF domain-containing protein, partial [Clostridia bacterium]|nr:PCRF domain-containing protein [Clostridia bacterium]